MLDTIDCTSVAVFTCLNKSDISSFDNLTLDAFMACLTKYVVSAVYSSYIVLLLTKILDTSDVPKKDIFCLFPLASGFSLRLLSPMIPSNVPFFFASDSLSTITAFFDDII